MSRNLRIENLVGTVCTLSSHIDLCGLNTLIQSTRIIDKISLRIGYFRLSYTRENIKIQGTFRCLIRETASFGWIWRSPAMLGAHVKCFDQGHRGANKSRRGQRKARPGFPYDFLSQMLRQISLCIPDQVLAPTGRHLFGSVTNLSLKDILV